MPSQMICDVIMVLPTKAVTRHMGSMQLKMTPVHPMRQRTLANICIPMEAMMQSQRELKQPLASVLRFSLFHCASPALTACFSAQFLFSPHQISPSSLHFCLHFSCYFLLAMPATLIGVPGASCFSCPSDFRCVSAKLQLICLQPALPHLFPPPPSLFIFLSMVFCLFTVAHMWLPGSYWPGVAVPHLF